MTVTAQQGGRGVPYLRRVVLAEPRRLLAAGLGIGLAFMLMLLLGGLWDGVRAQVTQLLVLLDRLPPRVPRRPGPLPVQRHTVAARGPADAAAR
jgi:hypothetical protein